MKVSGKMELMIKLKVTKKELQPLSRKYISGKTIGGQIDTPKPFKGKFHFADSKSDIENEK